MGANSSEYHAQTIERGHPDFAVSPSALKLFANCASKWRSGFQPAETKTKKWGNLLDCLVLTPDQFKARYVVQPETYTSAKGEVKPWSNNAKACKEWAEDYESEGIEVISFETHKKASAAVMRLRADETIRNFIDSSEKQVWVAGEWHDEATGLVIPVRCLIDLVANLETEFAKCLGDLKSTRSASIASFNRDAWKFGYYIQAAFDLDLYRAARPEEDRMTWCLIVSENIEPWQTAKRMMEDCPNEPTNLIDLGRLTYKRLLQNYCVCLKTGVWPDYEQQAENDPHFRNYIAQGWFAMHAEPWMADLPIKFEFSGESDTDTEAEVEVEDVPH